MNNNHDQLQNTMYQMPTSLSNEATEPSAVVVNGETPISDAEVHIRFEEIVREEILDSYNQMTRDLERDAFGIDASPQIKIEARVKNPIAVEMQRLGAEFELEMVKHHQALITQAQNMHPFMRAYIWLTAKDASTILKPTIESIINQHSKFGFEVFKRKDNALDPAHDPDISEINFTLQNGRWFLDQKSPVPTKSFTNMYDITEFDIIKSSTFSNELQTDIHRSEIISGVEAYNFWIASKKLFELVMTNIYKKP